MPVWKLTLTKQMDIFVEAPTRKAAIDAVESDIDYIPDLESEIRWCDLEVLAFVKSVNDKPPQYTVTEEGSLVSCE